MIATPAVWREIKASYALVERNINLSKRYWGWEVAFLVYAIAQSLSVIFIAHAVHASRAETGRFITYLAIGSLTWSYMAALFMCIAESVQWERWEGTIEYTLMAPITRLTYVLGSCLFAVIYGLVKTAVVLAVVILFVQPHANPVGFGPAGLIVVVGSVSFVGIGIMAATLPLLFTEKGAQMTYVIEACLLLVSGVYFPISALPAWLQIFSHLSPATYILSGTRTMLLHHVSGSALVTTLVPLGIIGIVSVPLGVWLFATAEHFAKRTGRLKRAG